MGVKKSSFELSVININSIRRLANNQKAANALKKAENNKRRVNNKIAANKQKRLQDLVRMLKLNNLIKNDPIAANQKINNLRPGQRFINKRPLLKAITNQDKINLKEYKEFWRQAKPSEKKNITSILRSEANNLRNRRAAAALASASASAKQYRANNNAALTSGLGN
jgi:hypothetical protein